MTTYTLARIYLLTCGQTTQPQPRQSEMSTPSLLLSPTRRVIRTETTVSSANPRPLLFAGIASRSRVSDDELEDKSDRSRVPRKTKRDNTRKTKRKSTHHRSGSCARAKHAPVPSFPPNQPPCCARKTSTRNVSRKQRTGGWRLSSRTSPSQTAFVFQSPLPLLLPLPCYPRPARGQHPRCSGPSSSSSRLC